MDNNKRQQQQQKSPPVPPDPWWAHHTIVIVDGHAAEAEYARLEQLRQQRENLTIPSPALPEALASASTPIPTSATFGHDDYGDDEQHQQQGLLEEEQMAISNLMTSNLDQQQDFDEFVDVTGILPSPRASSSMPGSSTDTHGQRAIRAEAGGTRSNSDPNNHQMTPPNINKNNGEGTSAGSSAKQKRVYVKKDDLPPGGAKVRRREQKRVAKHTPAAMEGRRRRERAYNQTPEGRMKNAAKSKRWYEKEKAKRLAAAGMAEAPEAEDDDQHQPEGPSSSEDDEEE